MAAFRRLVYAALCAGLLSGIFVAAAHQLGTVPLIIEAEAFEQAAPHRTGDAHGAAAPHENAAVEWALVNRLLVTAASLLIGAVGGMTLFGNLLVQSRRASRLA